MSDSSSARPIDLPPDLVARVEQRVQRTEFEDATAYVTHVLEDVLHGLEDDTDPAEIDAVDERQVEERLESLGYLNE